jgi:hypothetical protein
MKLRCALGAAVVVSLGLVRCRRRRPIDATPKSPIAWTGGNRQPRYPDRDYGRLDAAASQAWTQARKRGVPLRLNIQP